MEGECAGRDSLDRIGIAAVVGCTEGVLEEAVALSDPDEALTGEHSGHLQFGSCYGRRSCQGLWRVLDLAVGSVMKVMSMALGSLGVELQYW